MNCEICFTKTSLPNKKARTWSSKPSPYMTCMMTLCELCMMAISCESIQFSRGNSSRLCCVSSLRLQVKSSFTTTFKRQINSIQSESHWCLSALVVPLLQVSTTRWPKGPTIPIRRLVLANTKAWYSSQTVILNTLTTIFDSVMVKSLLVWHGWQAGP